MEDKTKAFMAGLYAGLQLRQLIGGDAGAEQRQPIRDAYNKPTSMGKPRFQPGTDPKPLKHYTRKDLEMARQQRGQYNQHVVDFYAHREKEVAKIRVVPPRRGYQK